MGWFEALVHRGARRAGRRLEEARRAYRQARALPEDEGGVRIVCRRYAEQRRVAVDDVGRPECFDAEHPACQGCVEDIQEGRIETW